MMRKLQISLGLAVVTLATAGLAQAPQTPSFTARTELVTVPVVVLQKHGARKQLGLASWDATAVTGLTRDAFELREDGHVQQIAFFDEVSDKVAPVRAVPATPGVYSNQVSAGDSPTNMVVIVMDLLNTPYEYQDPLREKVLNALRSDFRPDRPTMLAVIDSNGLRVLHDFTTDPRILASILQGIKGSREHDVSADTRDAAPAARSLDAAPLVPSADAEAELVTAALTKSGHLSPEGEFQRAQTEGRLQTTFTALQQLSQSLASVVGLKSILWASGGVVLPVAADTQTVGLHVLLENTVRSLASSGIVVYPIDTNLDTANPGYTSADSVVATRARLNSQSLLQKLQNFWDMAQRTGGEHCLLRKDGDCFRKAVGFTAHYYLLGYYTKSPPVATWRAIDVKVKGENLDVHARKGYMSGAVGTAEDRRHRDFAAAISSPVDSRSLPLTVHWPAAADAKAPDRHPFSLEVPPGALTIDEAENNHVQLHVAAVALDKKGKILGDFAQTIDMHAKEDNLARLRETGLTYNGALTVPPGTTKVKVMLRDDLSERIGSVSISLPEAFRTP